MTDTIWCWNCATEATQFIQDGDDHSAMCETCAAAFELGQCSPEARLRPIDELQDGEPTEMPQLIRVELSYRDEHNTRHRLTLLLPAEKWSTMIATCTLERLAECVWDLLS